MKLRLGIELTEKLQGLCDRSGLKMVAIVRKALKRADKVACYEVYSLLPIYKGSVITLESHLKPNSIRRIVNRFCDENKRTDEERDAAIQKELAMLIPVRDQLKREYAGKQAIIEE